MSESSLKLIKKESRDVRKYHIINLKNTVTPEQLREHFGEQYHFELEYESQEKEKFKLQNMNFNFWREEVKRKIINQIDSNAFYRIIIPKVNFESGFEMKSSKDRNDFKSNKRLIKLVLNNANFAETLTKNFKGKQVLGKSNLNIIKFERKVFAITEKHFIKVYELLKQLKENFINAFSARKIDEIEKKFDFRDRELEQVPEEREEPGTDRIPESERSFSDMSSSRDSIFNADEYSDLFSNLEYKQPKPQPRKPKNKSFVYTQKTEDPTDIGEIDLKFPDRDDHLFLGGIHK